MACILIWEQLPEIYSKVATLTRLTSYIIPPFFVLSRLSTLHRVPLELDLAWRGRGRGASIPLLQSRAWGKRCGGKKKGKVEVCVAG